MVSLERAPGRLRGRDAGRPARRQRDRPAARAARPRPPFKYRDLGSVAAIGRFRAICSVRGVRLSGFPAWVVWMFVHLAFLNGVRQPASRRWLRWLRWLLGHRRAERVFSVAHTGGDLSTPASVLRPDRTEPVPRAKPPDLRSDDERLGH